MLWHLTTDVRMAIISSRFSTAVIMQINTGHEIKDLDDVYVSIADDVCTTMTGGGPPGATRIDLCPLCACFFFDRHRLSRWLRGSK